MVISILVFTHCCASNTFVYVNILCTPQKSLKVVCSEKMTWAYVYFSIVLVMKIGMCDLPLGLATTAVLTHCGFLHHLMSYRE